MKILAVSGSLRPGSANTALLEIARDQSAAWAQLEIFRGLEDLPYFSPEKDGDPGPQTVRDFRNKIRQADGVMICTPEYAFGIPGVLKNALDWLVSSGELNCKPTAALSASPTPTGGDKAHAALRLVLTALGAEIVPEASFSIPMVYKKIDKNGRPLDAALLDRMQSAVRALAQRISPGD